MDIRKIETRSTEESHDFVKPEKPRRPRSSRREKEPSPLSGLLAIGVIIGIGVLFAFSTLTNQNASVRGVQDKKEPLNSSKNASEAATAIRNRVDDRLEAVKEQVADLSGQDFIADSPQVQKIITDLQALQGLPAGKAREVCESICQSIE